MRKADRAFLAFVLILLSVPTAAPAQSLTGALEWLPAGSLSAQALSRQPREVQEGGSHQSFYAEFGRLAFRSPDILGGTARKAGLSCQACHTNGDVNRAFFIPGLSGRPGHVDVSHAFWHARAEDHRDNPLEIPSLRAAKARERFGHDRRVGSLREFTRRVIVTEFGGAEPHAVLLDALVAYQETLLPGTWPDEPVSVEADMADLLRHLDTLALPLAEEDAALATEIALMIRGQIGFIHERFPNSDADSLRIVMEDWSRQLAKIATLANSGGWPAARSMRDALRNAVTKTAATFTAQADNSLYNPRRLAAWLSMRVQ